MTAIRSQDIAPITVLTDQLRLLLRSSQSPNQMSVMLVEVPPGSGVPSHFHDKEEEAYFVLEGELSLTVGDQTHVLGPNGLGHVPPRTVHGYTNTCSTPVRLLAWTVGGPLDQFFEAMGERVRHMPEDALVMMELTQRYGIRMMPHARP